MSIYSDSSCATAITGGAAIAINLISNSNTEWVDLTCYNGMKNQQYWTTQSGSCASTAAADQKTSQAAAPGTSICGVMGSGAQATTYLGPMPSFSIPLMLWGFSSPPSAPMTFSKAGCAAADALPTYMLQCNTNNCNPTAFTATQAVPTAELKCNVGGMWTKTNGPSV